MLFSFALGGGDCADAQTEINAMAALLETDSAQLPELIKVAAGTLLHRLLVLTASRGNESEVGAVEDALGSLAVLKRENDSAWTKVINLSGSCSTAACSHSSIHFSLSFNKSPATQDRCSMPRQPSLEWG